MVGIKTLCDAILMETTERSLEIESGPVDEMDKLTIRRGECYSSKIWLIYYDSKHWDIKALNSYFSNNENSYFSNNGKIVAWKACTGQALEEIPVKGEDPALVVRSFNLDHDKILQIVSFYLNILSMSCPPSPD